MKTITVSDLRAAFVQWEQAYRDGKTLSHEEAAQLTVNDMATQSANHFWALLPTGAQFQKA